MDGKQGDQILRIFSYWVTVCFGQLFATYRNSPDYGATYFKSFVIIYYQNRFVRNFGRFFPGASGHPDGKYHNLNQIQ
jgi:hypothetical protein